MAPSIPIWRQIQRKNITQPEKLADYLCLDAQNRVKLLYNPRFPLNLPLRLAEKIAKNTLDDPILRQFVPLKEETQSQPGFTLEPVQDQLFLRSKKILHKYKGRALVLATSACAMHCRYCFRQNFPYETRAAGFNEELAYIQSHKDISEIILSGGDPLSLSNEALQSLFHSLDAISHVKRIRFHTRFPIGIPERIDDAFLHLLASSSKQIFFIIHCNHARELDGDIKKALKKIQRLGIPILNQSVLLKGVNDTEEAMLALSETLIDTGIVPYYLHQLDPVEGAGHFAVTDAKGLELIEYLRKNTSGFGVPKLVREEVGASGKTTLTHPSDIFQDEERARIYKTRLLKALIF